MRRTLALIALLPALVLAACGEKKDAVTPSGSTAAQSLRLMLDYFPNADHVGIYRALADGEFKRAGLHVDVVAPSDPAEPLKLLAAGKVDVAVSYEPEVLLARDAGAPIVSIAAIVQQPLTSLISLESKHVASVADLRGKTVGDAGIPYQRAYLQTILAKAGIPAGSVREVNVGFNLVPAMLSGRVDATLGAFWNYEALQLRQMGRRPVVQRMPALGVPNYDELVLVTRTADVAKREQILRRFVQALGRGYESARQDPATAVADLVRASPALDTSLQLASVRATLPAFFPPAPHPWGWQDGAAWNAYGEWMLSHGLIKHSAAVVDASDDELLAGQGL